MEQIGKIHLHELVNNVDEIVEKEYCDILKNVEKDSTYYLSKSPLEKDKWIYLKEMSKYRKNIVDWIPIEKNMDVLEIMSGCGAITGVLSEKAKSVTCLESSKIKSMINALCHKESDNIGIYIGDFYTFTSNVEQKYDYIFWINDVAEYKKIVPEHIEYKDLLKKLKCLLKKQGKLVLAVNNEFGMRYWAGCQDETTECYFGGIEGRAAENNRIGFTKHSLLSNIQAAGYTNVKFYYPYPDYQFPVVIYSDEYMPKRGELNRNMCNFQYDRMVLFDEERVFDRMIENNLFSLYSNSYLVIAEGV